MEFVQRLLGLGFGRSVSPASTCFSAGSRKWPMSNSTVLVVGGSLAGGRAAEQVRRLGYEGRVVLVGEEPHRPYDRPPLSKKFLLGELEQDRLFLRPTRFYEKKEVELRFGVRATALDTTAREVTFDDGSTIAFEHLVIATGAGVRRLRCPGAELEGVHYLRTLEDSLAIRRDLETARRAVVIGAGVIGAEVAAACRAKGVEVVMLEALETPLLRAFGADVGGIYGEVHRARGVDLRVSTLATELRGSGRVEAVVTDRGEEIPCDVVVVGIGVTPNVEWLGGSGVALDRGVLVDARCQTNVEGVWAAGDVARWWSERVSAHVTVESIDNAQYQSTAVAKNIMGKETLYDPVPFFWSDQYDLKLQSVGHVGPYDEVVYRGSVPERAFCAFHLRAGKLAFAIGVGRLQELGAAKKLIAAGVEVTAAELGDEAFDLKGKVPKKVK